MKSLTPSDLERFLKIPLIVRYYEATNSDEYFGRAHGSKISLLLRSKPGQETVYQISLDCDWVARVPNPIGFDDFADAPRIIPISKRLENFPITLKGNLRIEEKPGRLIIHGGRDILRVSALDNLSMRLAILESELPADD